MLSHKKWRRSNTTTEISGYHEMDTIIKESLAILDTTAIVLEQDRQFIFILSSDNHLLKTLLLISNQLASFQEINAILYVAPPSSLMLRTTRRF